MSLRDEILARDDLKREEVDTAPEWGHKVWVRVMTGSERDAYDQWCLDNRGADKKQNMVGIRAKLAVLTTVDESGARVFRDGDEKELGGKNSAALDKIFSKALRINGITKDDVEELTKNSDAPPTDVSG